MITTRSALKCIVSGVTLNMDNVHHVSATKVVHKTLHESWTSTISNVYYPNGDLISEDIANQEEDSLTPQNPLWSSSAIQFFLHELDSLIIHHYVNLNNQK